MEEYRQITLDEWTQWKEDIRRKLEETAGNFVYIGYRLKQIRDSGMYDGAADIFEFAEKEYGLGKSTVSRFIAINEKYSEGGNSLELKEEFRGFSSSKLSEMLTLPDSEVELITEKTTIREIRELKAFNSQSQEDTGESAGAAGGEERRLTPLEKCLVDFFKDKKAMLEDVIGCMREDPPMYKEAAELMAPSQTSHRKGIVFLFLYDWNIGVKYKLMTEPEPVSLSWTELLDIIYGIFGACEKGDVWMEPVATSQQDEEKEPTGEGEVKQEDETEKTQQEEAAGVENEEGRENKAQGEACADSGKAEGYSVDSKYADEAYGAAGRTGEDSAGGSAGCEGGAGVAPMQPESEQMPEKPEMTRTEAETEGAADAEERGGKIIDSDGMRRYIENQKKIIRERLQVMGFRCDEGDWDGLIETAKEIITRAESIKSMEEMWNG